MNSASSVIIGYDELGRPLHEAAIIGVLPNGKVIRAIQGGAQASRDDDDNDDDQDDEDDDDDNLLDDDEDEEDDVDDDDDDDDKGRGKGRSRRRSNSDNEDIDRRIQSEVDRRVNQALRRRELNGRDDRDRGRSSSSRSGSGRRSSDSDRDRGRGTSSPTIPREDLQDARLTYRETLSDQGRLSAEEKALARELAPAVLRAKLKDGLDPDDAGEAAAKEVYGRIRGLQKHYSGRVRKALDRQGLLTDEARRKGTPNGKGGSGRVTPADAHAASQAERVLNARRPGRKQSQTTGS